ncbi:MAG TPA: phosphoribosyltransferase [Candidatus Cybelea sp.]|nr:phosphoribosyltransferase [Candidatus Cybelea sp.]
MFSDREDAGRRLAAALTRFTKQDPVVLALPRGGVPVGIEVATALDAPLDLVIVRKLGAPDRPELAIGAVVDGEHSEVILNREVVDYLGVSPQYIAAERAREMQEIERRRRTYLAGRSRVTVEGRTAIIVDDGIATGATMRAAITATRRLRPKRLVFAVPVAPTDTLDALRGEVDEAVCLESHVNFPAISLYYRHFPQVSDEEVRQLMARAKNLSAKPSGRGDAHL